MSGHYRNDHTMGLPKAASCDEMAADDLAAEIFAGHHMQDTQ